MKVRFPCMAKLKFPARRHRRKRAEEVSKLNASECRPGPMRVPRGFALALISTLVAVASLVSFAESYRGLYLWAHRHGLAGLWSAIWPLQVDVFIAVGELALFVALVDRWAPRSRTAAWAVTLTGLAVSVAGNVGHVTGHSLTVRATAAVPPIAAAAALAVGLGVLKRVVEQHYQAAAVHAPDALSVPVPTDAQNAALMALKATIAAGNPLSGRQLETRFGLSRAEATKVRQLAVSSPNGRHPHNGAEPPPDQQPKAPAPG
jgi:hypothetical protein